MKKTAVDFLVDSILEDKGLFESAIRKAKQMEKHQIVTAYNLARVDSFVDETCNNEKPNDGEAFYDWYYER